MMASQKIAHEHLTQYHTASKSGGWRFLPDAGVLVVRGADRLPFFQRQTTNDLRKLTDNNYMVSILTSPTARILDVLTIMQQGDDLLVCTLPGRGITTKNYLQSRIFFMDKVSIQDPEHEIRQIELIGPSVVGFLLSLGLDGVEHTFRATVTRFGEDVIALGPQVAGLLGCRLLVPEQVTYAVIQSLAEHGFIQIAPEIYEVLRIEAGIPGAQSELTQDYTPLETGLEAVISSSKGCYTGQEVIARQITYDKITRRLSGLKIQAEADPLVTTGDQVYADNQPVGKLTSCAFSPAFGWIGLAILKRPYDSPAQQVQIFAPEPVLAEIVALPFVDKP